MLKKKIFIGHFFNKKHFFKIRRKKEVIFDLEDNTVTEQLISTSEDVIINKVTEDLEALKISEQVNLALWQEILEKMLPISKSEFHRGLNSVRNLNTLNLL
ncbi:uncharacterized protein OCT59_025849 [Rhizophagus irregularis]|uniref:uncharacterized protein n=1 Tax=Rhizophagus irregularis TaxID=588596 RepID=UPI00331BE68E|nr:hypothetical protein OCT59_025849 [Rhizophagus irregularis]